MAQRLSRTLEPLAEVHPGSTQDGVDMITQTTFETVAVQAMSAAILMMHLCRDGRSFAEDQCPALWRQQPDAARTGHSA